MYKKIEHILTKRELAIAIAIAIAMAIVIQS